MSAKQLKTVLPPNPALKQKRWWGAILISVGGFMILAGLGYAFINVFGDLLPVFLGVACSYLGVRLLNRGRRHFVPVGLVELEKESRPPALYLRPFSQDGSVNLMTANAINRGMIEKGFWRQMTTIMFRFYDTYEQFISLAFKKIGPVVAIGDPVEGLPHLGAIRIYVGIDGDWQQMVSKLARKASYVILQIGKTEGLMWEVQHVINHVRPEQLILFLPNQKSKITRLGGFKSREQDRQDIYQVFRTKTQAFFPKPLPGKIGGAMIIYFDRDWKPIPTYFQSERILAFRRTKASTSDPKLEAINWLNSVMC